SNGICTSMTKRSPRNKKMFTLLKVVGERARSPTTFVMITNQKCQLYPKAPTFEVLFRKSRGALSLRPLTNIRNFHENLEV
ncbi:MAG: hypothetical protein IJN02_04725, partial [Bacteroidales bacterium]|nr:hypothetical protein [Bacteroidales bacterium]